MTDELSKEELKQILEEISKNIDSGKYRDTPDVYKRYIALQVFGKYMPLYDNLSADEKQNFGFDIEGLTKKVKDLLN